MSHRQSLIDRLVLGLFALLALAGGGGALLWALGHPLGDVLAESIDLDAVDNFMTTP